MSSEILRTYKVIKNFLFGVINKEFLVFMFFLAMSAFFWMLMTLNETYEREIHVPVRMVSVPNNVVITDPLPDTIKVTVRDKGYILLPYVYGDVIQTINVPFPNYAKSSGKGAITSAELQRLVRSVLYGSTTIVSVKADKLDFTYNYGLSKKVPVLFDGSVNVADKYYLARTKVIPDSVMIYASRSMLDSIKEVYTSHIEVENLEDTLSKTVHIRKIPGVKIVPDKVKVTLFADVLTEKIVEVPITSVNMPEGLVLRTFPGHVEVKVVVGRASLAAVSPENFKVVVDYNEVADHPSDKCLLNLRVVPRGVTSATLMTQHVDYLIENVK